MSNIVEAEYEIVQERTLPVIIGEIKIIEQNTARIVLENGIQIGQRLQEAKEKVGHGGFGDWCQQNLNYSQDTAQKFMRLAKEYGDPDSVLANTAMSRNFSISNALSLLKLPEEDREKFIEEHPIEDMTNKALEEEIRKLKAEKATLEEEVTNVAKDRSEVGGRLAEAEATIERLKGQIAMKDAQPQADPAEIEDLKTKLQKAEDARDKAKDKLKKEKDARQAAIEKELAEQAEKIREEAKAEVSDMLGDLQSMKDQLEEENRNLQHKLENAGNDAIVRFKVLVDQLQDTFEACGQCILDAEAGTNPELSNKMNAVMKTVIESFQEAL